MPSQTKPKSRRADNNAPSSSSAAAAAAAAAQNDARFAAISSDPRYRLPSARHSRVKVDERFAGMFKDDDFSKKASVDRYGRVVNKGSGKKELEKFYRLDEDDGESKAKAKAKGRRVADSHDEEESEDEQVADDDDDVQAELDRVERKALSARDYARQGGFSDSSSDEESSSDEDEDQQGQDDVELPDEQHQVPMGQVSNRLAVVNLDWDNIRATDLMAVALSFAPGGKGVQSVVVYPSEFGRERMEREEHEGPPRDIFASAPSSTRQQDDQEDEDSEEEEERIKKELLQPDTGDEFDSAALRQYQLDRLKYYYAVITCDNTTTAKALYDDMDGREYLTTANFFDLRFVPDDVDFDTDTPRDQCSKLPPGYKPNEFVTDALTHSKVRLTWDADDTTRKEVQRRAFSRAEIDQNDLQAYIGSDSDSDGEDAAAADPNLGKSEAQRQKMRAALGLTSLPASSDTKKKNKANAPVGDMQITFTSGLSGAAAGEKAAAKGGNSVFENDPSTVHETTREAYIRKEKERKQRRKEKAKAARGGLDGHDAEQMEASKDDDEDAKAAADQEEEEGGGGGEGGKGEDLGFDDPFFTDMPTAQKAERDARKAEKDKKRQERQTAERASAAQRAELELLMVDDKADAAMRHFDMNEIAKAEKKKNKKKSKKGKKKGEDEEDDGNGDGQIDGSDFKISTQDPRFAGLFESHEFAIDPTNPRFQNTAGNRALLEEGRKKRKARVVDDGEEDGDQGERRIKKGKSGGSSVAVEATQKKNGGGGGVDAGAGEGGGEDLQKLLARVKAKAKRKD